MGDAGSMFLGFALTWYAIALSQGETRALPPAAALWFLMIPIFDAVSMMLRRILKGRSPFAADREHLHHIFLLAGYSVNETVLVMTGVASCGVFVGLASIYFQVPELVVAGAFLLTGIGYFWMISHAWKVMRFLRTSICRRQGAGDRRQGPGCRLRGAGAPFRARTGARRWRPELPAEADRRRSRPVDAMAPVAAAGSGGAPAVRLTPDLRRRWRLLPGGRHPVAPGLRQMPRRAWRARSAPPPAHGRGPGIAASPGSKRISTSSNSRKMPRQRRDAFVDAFLRAEDQLGPAQRSAADAGRRASSSGRQTRLHEFRIKRHGWLEVDADRAQRRGRCRHRQHEVPGVGDAAHEAGWATAGPCRGRRRPPVTRRPSCPRALPARAPGRRRTPAAGAGSCAPSPAARPAARGAAGVGNGAGAGDDTRRQHPADGGANLR